MCNLKVDSKGGYASLLEIREEIREVAVLRKTPKGYLLPSGKEEDFPKNSAN